MEQAQPPLWKASLQKALNHGGTRRKKRDRSEAKRKQVQVATVDKESGRPSCRTMVFRGFCSATAAATKTTAPPSNDGDGDEDGYRDEDGGCAQSGSATAQSVAIDTGGGAAATYPMLITDTRSGKYADFLGAPDCEICWWLDEAAVQFRIAGRVLLAADAARTAHPALWEARRDVWERLSDGSKRTFFWDAPGKTKRDAVGVAGARTGDGDAGAGIDGAGSTGGVGSPMTTADISPYFALCIIVPDRVDELRLGGNQKRFIHTLAREGTVDGSEAARTRADTEDSLWLLRLREWITEEVNP